MCGRYFLSEDDLELMEVVRETNRRALDKPVKTRGEVFPTDAAPVIAPNRERQPGAFAMVWGFQMPDGRRVINARSETASEKPLFKESFARRRCAVPASHYFEWARKSRGKPKYAIGAEGGGIIYLAGLYRLEGATPTFTILTREPAAGIAFIHDRMPVLLPKDAVSAWLSPDIDPMTVLSRARLDVAARLAPGESEQLSLPI